MRSRRRLRDLSLSVIATWPLAVVANAAQCPAQQVSAAAAMSLAEADCERRFVRLPGAEGAETQRSACLASARSAYAGAHDGAVSAGPDCAATLPGAQMQPEVSAQTARVFDPLRNAWTQSVPASPHSPASRNRRFATLFRVTGLALNNALSRENQFLAAGATDAAGLASQRSAITAKLTRRLRNLTKHRVDYNGPAPEALAALADGAVDGIAALLLAPTDSTPPAVAIAGLDDDTGTAGDFITNDASLRFNGTAEAGSTVEVRLDGELLGSVTADAAGLWSLDHGVADGTHVLEVSAVDAAGNRADASHALTVDSVGPALAISGIDDDTGTPGDFDTGDANLIFNGTVEPGSLLEIRLDDLLLETIPATPGDSWSFDHGATTLADGGHRLQATAIDAAGNRTLVSQTIVVNRLNSGLAITGIEDDTGTPGDFTTSDTTLLFHGTARPLSEVEIFLDGIVLGVADTDEAGFWHFDHRAHVLADGVHELRASVAGGSVDPSPTSASRPILIDTVPIAVAITAIGADTGTPGDFVTTDATLIFSGTADPGSLVEITLDGALLATVAAGSGGHWTHDHSAVRLAVGKHTLAASTVDLVGNRNSAQQSIRIDQPPVTVAITGIADDTGTPGDFATSDPTLIFQGDATPSSRVEVKLDGTALGTVTADDAGHWSFDYRAVTLTDGSHELAATATDAAGQSATANRTLRIGASAVPVAITGISEDTGIAGDFITSDAQLLIGGTAAAGSVVSIFRDDSFDGTATADASGHWSFASPVAMNDGPHTLKATATDSVGHVTSDSRIVVVDSQIIAFSKGISDDTGTPGDFITSDASLIFSGSAEPGSSVTVRLDGQTLKTVTADPQGNWSYDHRAVTLADGDHPLEVIQVDPAGNRQTLGHVVTVDTTPPSVSAAIGDDTGTPGDFLTGDATLVFHGTAEAGSTVEIRLGGTSLGIVAAGADGQWSFDYSATPLNDGTYALDVTATDAAGNRGSDTHTIHVDATLPKTPISVSVPEAENGLTTAEAGDGTTVVVEVPPTFLPTDKLNVVWGNQPPITVSIPAAALGSVPIPRAGIPSVSVPVPPETIQAQGMGAVTVTAYASDDAGNLSQTASTVVVVTESALTPGVDVTVSAQAPATVSLGSEFSVTLTYKNVGTEMATNVVGDVSPTIATRLLATDDGCMPQGTGESLHCAIGTLRVAESVSKTLRFKALSGYTAVTAYSGATDDQVWENNSVQLAPTTEIPGGAAGSDVSVELIPGWANPGPDVNVGYRLVVTHLGPDPITAPFSVDQGVLDGILASVDPACSGDTEWHCGFDASPEAPIYPGTAYVRYLAVRPKPGANSVHLSAVLTPPAGLAGNDPANDVSETGPQLVTGVSNPQPDIAVHLEPSPGPYTLGDAVTYTATIKNVGTAASPVFGVRLDGGYAYHFNDGWSIELYQFVKVITNGAGCVSADLAKSVYCPITPLQPGESTTKTFALRLLHSDYQQRVPLRIRTFGLDGYTPQVAGDTVAANDYASSEITVSPLAGAGADLLADLLIPEGPVSNQNFSYSLRAFNLGAERATGVHAMLSLQNLSFVSADIGCHLLQDGSVDCEMGDLEPGAIGMKNVVVHAGATGQITNTMKLTATGSDPVAGNNQSSATAAVVYNDALGPDIAGTGSADVYRVSAGGKVQVTWRYVNIGTETATNVHGEMFMPQAASIVSMDSGCRFDIYHYGGCELGDLGVGDIVEKRIVFELFSGPENSPETAWNNHWANDAVPQNNGTQLYFSVFPLTSAGSDLRAGLNVPPTAKTGVNTPIRLMASNLGADLAANAVATLNLNGLTFASADSDCTHDPVAETVTCALGDLLAPYSVYRQIVVRGDATGSYTPTLTISSATSDPNPANDAASASFTAE